MPNFKEVWVYSLGINSWSEIFYSTDTSLDSATQFPDKLINSRLAFLHPDATLSKIRVSQVDALRAATPVTINRAGLYKGDDGPDVINTAAIINLASTEVPSARKVWVRGLPDSYVLREPGSDKDDPPGAFIRPLKVWITQLAANGYQVQSLARISVPPVGNLQFFDISQVSGTPGAGTAQVTLKVPFGLAPPSRVIISQVNPKVLPGINGHWTNTSTGLQTVTINYNMPQAGPIVLAKGHLRPEQYLYGTINKDISGFSFYRSRKTGKSFLGGRGRKTAVRIRSL